MGSKTEKGREPIGSVLTSRLSLLATGAQSPWGPSETLNGRHLRPDAQRDKKAELVIHQFPSLTVDGHFWDIKSLEFHA